MKSAETETKTGTKETDKTGTKSGGDTPKKNNIWLWVLGWIFVFPLPLTILLLRNKKINKNIKIVIIAIAWILYIAILASSSGSSDTDTDEEVSVIEQEDSEEETTEEQEEEVLSGNITELSFTKDEDVEVEVGETVSPGYLDVSVDSRSEFSPEDVVFISDNPEVAEISFTEDKLTTHLYFEITGISGGETDVYATSEDGSITSNIIHVVVPEPIVVETVELEGYETDLVIGETTEVEVNISPSDAKDKTITWSSSDESVATVDEDGNVTAVGGGSATIAATSSNGVQASFDITVDGTKTLMKLTVKRTRQDDVSIGDEWTYDIEVNGEKPSNTMGVGVGDVISFSATFTEEDTNPDVGSASTSYTVTEDDIINGFEVSMDLYVTENGGRYSGQTAHFVVTFTFSPNS